MQKFFMLLLTSDISKLITETTVSTHSVHWHYTPAANVLQTTNYFRKLVSEK